MSAVEVRGLEYAYSGHPAIRGIDLQVSDGEVYVLAGPDGAGKSTLLRILSTLLEPDAGTVRLYGREHAGADPEMRRRLGYLPQGFTLYEDLTVEENLRFFGDLYEMPELDRRVGDLLEWSGLTPFRKRASGHLSGGMKQKLSLASLLLHDPHLLLLDEPTTGIDVPTRRDFWDYLLELRGRGMTVVVATPYLEEARQADRVAFLHDGKIVVEMSPAGLLASLPGRMWEVAAAEPEAARERLRACGRLPLVTWRARRVRFMTPAGMSDAEVRSLLASLAVQEAPEPVEPTFEDAFLVLARRAA
ncbi:MAG: ABC transporter ATP-binding protein [Armatimonadetes bacterium]|nr:ABC transporter ATP-binding protein [Armatimonadota bacterium]